LGVGRWALGVGRWALGVGRWALGVETIFKFANYHYSFNFHLFNFLQFRIRHIKKMY
jgi:hypothetical protein